MSVTVPSSPPNLDVFWFLPTHGDGRHLGTSVGGRPVDIHDLRQISPNLWAGVGLVRGGAGTALVGDPETVAARMQEYMALGIDTFILSGYPHLEEAYRFAELVFPLLPRAASGRAAAQALNRGPFGETIAGEYVPAQHRATPS